MGLLDFGEHSICGTTCEHAPPFVESPRDIARRESGFPRTGYGGIMNRARLTWPARSARRILPFPHHAPWTAGKRKAEPFDPARRSATCAWRKFSSAGICGEGREVDQKGKRCVVPVPPRPLIRRPPLACGCSTTRTARAKSISAGLLERGAAEDTRERRAILISEANRGKAIKLSRSRRHVRPLRPLRWARPFE